MQTPECEALLREQLDRMGDAPRRAARRADAARLRPRVGDRRPVGLTQTQSIAELAIDAEEDRLVRALLVGMLRERQHGGWRS